MTSLLLLLAPASPAQVPAVSPIAAEVAPAPAIVPDAKQIAAWVTDLSSKEYNQQIAAVNGLVRAGPRAKAHVPELIKLLGDKEGRSDNVVQILTAIGPDAKEAVPALLAQLRAGHYGYFVDRVAIAIAKIDGPRPEATRALLLSSAKCTPIMLTASAYLREYPAQVIPHLVDCCGDKNLTIQQNAVTVLGGLEWSFGPAEAKTILARAGEGAKGVPAALERLLAADDVQLRIHAARAIAHVAPELAPKTIPVVVQIVLTAPTPDKVPNVEAPGIFLPVPAEAATALIPLFDHDKEHVRFWAINTLAALPVSESLETVLKNGKTARARQGGAIALGQRYQAARSAPALKAALADPEFIVRYAAAASLVRVSPRGSDTISAAVPALIEGLQQSDEETRLGASQLLVSVGEPAKAAVPTLKKLLAEKKLAVAFEAAVTLTEIAPADTADAIPVLVRGLSASGQSPVRAAVALRKIGPPAIAAVPELVKLFGAKDMYARIRAIEAAAVIDPTQTGKATESLVAILKDKASLKGTLRADVTTALVRIGPGAKAAVPTLMTLLKDKGNFHTGLALAAVAIDPDGATEAREWLANLIAGKLPDEDPTDLADHLHDLGPKAKPFLPELMLMLQSKTNYLRTEAAEVLGEIGPDAKAALPLLKELAEKDKVANVRRTAAEAVKKIEK